MFPSSPILNQKHKEGIIDYVWNGYAWDADATTSLTDVLPTTTTVVRGLMSSADKVKLDGIATGAEVNVQSDWNAVNGDAFILNKPTIPIAVAGENIVIDNTNPSAPIISSTASDYTLPTATSTAKGGIELFSDTVQTVAASAVSTTASRTYGIQLNSSGQAVVNVPWIDTNTTYSNATTSVSGLMSSTDKTKLDGVATGANNYVLPASVVHDTEASALHSTDALRISGTTLSLYKGDGTFESVTTQDTVYTHPTTDGNLHVPATGTTNNGKVLTAGATAGSLSWGVPTDTNTTYTFATGTTNGTFNVTPSDGSLTPISIYGLGTAAYTASTAYAASGHTHNYAGSSSAGGAATTALACTGNAATATKSTNLTGGNSTTSLGAIPYQSNTDTTSLLSPNTSTIPKALVQAGTGTDGAAPVWTAIEDRLGTSIASGPTVTVGTAGLGDYIHITGTTNITSFGTATSAGIRRTLIFDGVLILTHNATSLICVGGGNIVTVAGMVIEVVAETTANWRVVSITHPSISARELGYLDGVTSSVQTQLDARVLRDSATGAAYIPSGTTAQRPASPANGYTRYNTDLLAFEGYSNGSWTSLGGGSVGGGQDKIFYLNGQTITTDYTIPVGQNAMTAGDITIASGVTVTVSSGSKWSIV